MAYTILDSPVGRLFLESTGGKIRRLAFLMHETPQTTPHEMPGSDHDVLWRAVADLAEYFNGARKRFSVPVAVEGPLFHKKVWDILNSIPFGETVTYSEVAREAGSPGAARAVGNACAANPVAIIIPCHRVLAKSGMGGFGGGLDAKQWLLRHEGYLP